MTDSERAARDLLGLMSPEDAMLEARETLRNLKLLADIMPIHKGSGFNETQIKDALSYVASEQQFWQNVLFYMRAFADRARDDAKKIIEGIAYGNDKV